MTDTSGDFTEFPKVTPVADVDALGIRQRQWPKYEDLVDWTATAASDGHHDHLEPRRAKVALDGARAAVSHATRLPLHEPNGDLCKVPHNVFLGTLMLAQQFYLNMPVGSAGAVEVGGVVSTAFDNPEVKALIGPYRVFGLA